MEVAEIELPKNLKQAVRNVGEKSLAKHLLSLNSVRHSPDKVDMLAARIKDKCNSGITSVRFV